MSAQAIIQIDHLCKAFGRGEERLSVLEDVTLSVEEGEIFGIIGPSGAGKSTLLRCINGLERPSSGSVRVNGKEISSMEPAALRRARREIGMIFQGFHLLMQRTALENICFPLEIAGIKKSRALQRAREMLELVGLSEKAEAYPAQLSGGQKQRVAIARALANQPKILLCDEASSALDPGTSRSILALIRELNRKMGISVVLVTHEMRVIGEICKRVAILSRGHIAESGPVGEVFLRPKTEDTRKLIFPEAGGLIGMAPAKGPLVRLVFDGDVDKPTVSKLVLSCGAAVSILFAETRTIAGRCYGQMLIRLPEDAWACRGMLARLEEEDVSYEVLEEPEGAVLPCEKEER
ncbi:MAG: ATP-binding cassette domain-containing protein [Bacillota bacterium]|nr:ATP-binding cassette domain-containing protein [Bacillota bacterium]